MKKFKLFSLAAAFAVSVMGAFAAESVDYKLTPEGGVVKDLQTIKLEFPNNKNVGFYENSTMPVAVLENVTTGDIYNCSDVDTDVRAESNGKVFTLVFMHTDAEEVTPITTPGDYKLAIRAFGLLDAETNEITEDLPPIYAEYTINYPVNYALTPAPGIAKDLMTISIDFTDAKNIGFYENNPMPVAVLENLTTGTTYVCQEADRNMRALTEGIAYDLTFIGEDEEEAMPITQPGDYQLTIRAFGYMDEDNQITEDLPVIVANYTIEYPEKYVFDPEEGVVTNLQGITLNFTENNKVAFYPNLPMAAAVLVNLNTGNEYEAFDPTRNTFYPTDGAAYTLTFFPVGEETMGEDVVVLPIQEPGNYVLTVRGLGIAGETDADGMEDSLPVITAHFTIDYPIAYALDPMAGSAVSDLTNITIEFPNNRNVEFPDNSRMPSARLQNIETGEVYVCQTPDRDPRAMSEGAVFTMTFIPEDGDEAEPIKAVGSYLLTIDGMYLAPTAEGEEPVYLPRITANYSIYNVYYILDPMDGTTVENLQTITLTFPENNNIAFYENNTMPVAVLVNTTTDVTYACQTAERDTFAEVENGVAYILNFIEEDTEDLVPIATDGVYKLTIRALGYVDEDGEMGEDSLPVITATYVIAGSGVEALEMMEEAEEVYNIFTITGIQVVSNGTADAVRNLGAGLYIINGKKVLIRN